MSDSVTTVAGTIQPVPRPRARAPGLGPWGWARTNLFGSWMSGIVTLLIAVAVLRVVWGFIDWGLVHAVWHVPNNAAGQPDTDSCRAVKGIGACWAVVGEKYRFILFGFFPYDQQWRPAICILLFVALYGLSAWRRMWRIELLYVWVATLLVIGVLMWGGVLGLPYVGQDQWGGLAITLILATFGLAFAFPWRSWWRSVAAPRACRPSASCASAMSS